MDICLRLIPLDKQARCKRENMKTKTKRIRIRRKEAGPFLMATTKRISFIFKRRPTDVTLRKSLHDKLPIS